MNRVNRDHRWCTWNMAGEYMTYMDKWVINGTATIHIEHMYVTFKLPWITIQPVIAPCFVGSSHTSVRVPPTSQQFCKSHHKKSSFVRRPSILRFEWHGGYVQNRAGIGNPHKNKESCCGVWIQWHRGKFCESYVSSQIEDCRKQIEDCRGQIEDCREPDRRLS